MKSSALRGSSDPLRKTMKKIILPLATVLVSFSLGIFVFILFSFFFSLPKEDGSLRTPYLSGKVEIYRDKWGVPHIFSQNEKDLFFAVGFIQAQERMWQMELTRRAAQGRLSEIFGETTLERDRQMRNFGLKVAAEKDYLNLSEEMKELLSSYCQGVNFWLSSRKFSWPPEFFLLRFRPQPWTLLDSLLVREVMALLLSLDYASEIVRTKIWKKFGEKRAQEILEEGVKFPSSSEIEAIGSILTAPFPFQGSNNWVLSGSRTKSGKPLLANDPHLEISLPPVWFEMHIHSPTLEAIGVSLPGVPLIIIGHNRSIAWGVTNSCVDVQDLYIERLNAERNAYFDGGDWKPVEKRVEEIKIRWEKYSEKIEVIWTKRGPVISPVIVKSENPLSLCWTIYEGGRALEAFYRLNKAQNFEEFKEALSLFDVPSQNFLYADIYGNIGYYLSGKIPLRAEEIALFPYPGWKEEGKWQGFLKEEKKPVIFNPDQGFIISANNRIVAEDYPYYLGCDWDAAFRAERIRELIVSREKHDVESLKEIQNDVYSKKAELFLPLLRDLKGLEGKARLGQEILKDWNLEMDKGKEAALFEVFMNFLHENVFQDELGEDFKNFDSLFRMKKAGLLRIITDPDSPWFDLEKTSFREGRDEILEASLKDAWEWLEKNQGSAEDWDWTKIHSICFKHALGQVPVFKFFNCGNYPLNGDAFTVRASFSSGYKTTHGASYRLIVDLGNWDNSVSVLTSGQSGHFLSRHYDDQISLWLKGQYHPLFFSEEGIKNQSSAVLSLEPQKKNHSCFRDRLE